MTGRRVRADEATLVDLLVKGDFAGFEKVTGMSIRDLEPEPGDDVFDSEDDYLFDDDQDADEEDWPLRPDWLHPDCLSVCTALDLETCCKYPDNPLVRVAVDLADSVERAVGGLCGDRAPAAAGLARHCGLIPGLLAQVHAILPRLNKTALAQLLCPVGRLGSALDQACGRPGQLARADVGAPGWRAELASLRPLLDECADAIRAALGSPLRPRQGLAGQAPAGSGQGRPVVLATLPARMESGERGTYRCPADFCPGRWAHFNG